MWTASKPGSDESDQPNHEIDVLSGHENDVNYVQFRLDCTGSLPMIYIYTYINLCMLIYVASYIAVVVL